MLIELAEVGQIISHSHSRSLPESATAGQGPRVEVSTCVDSGPFAVPRWQTEAISSNWNLISSPDGNAGQARKSPDHSGAEHGRAVEATLGEVSQGPVSVIQRVRVRGGWIFSRSARVRNASPSARVLAVTLTIRRSWNRWCS